MLTPQISASAPVNRPVIVRYVRMMRCAFKRGDNITVGASRRCHVARMQRSITTVRPAARARAAASRLTIPSCIQIVRAPISIACSTTGGTASLRTNTSTASIASGTARSSG